MKPLKISIPFFSEYSRNHSGALYGGSAVATAVLLCTLATAAPLAAQPQTTSWGCPGGSVPTLIEFNFLSANPSSTPLPQGTEVGFDDDTTPPSWTCPSSGQCIFDPVSEDFSKGCNLTPTGGGEAACTQPWSLIGVYFHFDAIVAARGAFDDNPGADDARGPMMLFDTASTANGDSDLRSPHGGHGTSLGCPAGSPGVGVAQAGPGRFYANCPADIPDLPLGDLSGDLDDPDDELQTPLGNVMILSTNGSRTSPNDAAAGGVIIVLFPDFATTILRVSSVDIDDVDRRQIRLFSDLYGGNLIAPVSGCDPDDNDGNAGTLYDNADTELELGDVDCATNINPITDSQHVDADNSSPGGNVTASTDDDLQTTGDNTLVIQTDMGTLFPQVDPSVMADGGQLVRRMEFEILGSGSLDEIVFCRNESFTPVTVSYFAAEPTGSGVRFEWSTATETGNAGFILYAETADGWQRVNKAPIPSRVVDSTVPQRYSLEVPGLRAERFRLADVSVRGVQTFRGEVEIGSTQGEEPDVQPVAWASIRAERSQKAVRRAAAPAATAAAARSAARGTPSFATAALSVDRDGLYRVTYEQLATAGVDLAGARADQLALSSLVDRDLPLGERQAEPIRVTPSGAKLFGPGGAVEFLGEARDSLYTRSNVYHLGVNPKLAARVVDDPRPVPAVGSAVRRYSETLVVDEDNAYGAGSATGDPWYNQRLIAFGAPTAATFDFEVDDLLWWLGSGRLQLDVYGVSSLSGASPDHHVQVSLNGTVVADETFDGAAALRLDVPLPAGLLREGSNQVEVALPFDLGVIADIVDVDTYGVSYPRYLIARGGELAFDSRSRSFEVGGLNGAAGVEVWVHTSAERVHRMTEVALDGGFARFAGLGRGGRGYHVVAEEAVLTPQVSPFTKKGDGLLAAPADLLIVAHPDFLGAPPPGQLGLDDLVAARQGGSSPLTVEVVDVEEVYGRYTGGIVDSAALRAYFRDAVALQGADYVLLVGGDTYDYFDRLGVGSVSFIPTAYVETGQEFPVRYTPSDPWLVDLDDDRVPDLPIGRLPVRSSAELDEVLRKTLDYATAAHDERALLVADEVDLGLSFTSLSENLRGLLPPSWQVSTAYVDDLGRTGARAAALDSINQGAAVTSYFGHSGPAVWGRGMLTAAQAATGLVNVGLPTVVTQWGCWNTYFVEPQFNTMAHKLLLDTATAQAGAAAVLGATTLTEVHSDIKLGPELFSRMFLPGVRLGDAVQDAKGAMAATGVAPDDVILGWTLLGDPTLVIDE